VYFFVSSGGSRPLDPLGFGHIGLEDEPSIKEHFLYDIFNGPDVGIILPLKSVVVLPIVAEEDGDFEFE
jgi:hypothetical protein